jgi:hypothetical protein
MKTLAIILPLCQAVTGNWSGPTPQYPCAGVSYPDKHQFICANATVCVPLKKEKAQ